MATKYTHKKEDEVYHIIRNDEHVATLDPTTEEVTILDGNSNYAAPIGRVVAEIMRGAEPEEPAEPEAPAEPEEPAEPEAPVDPVKKQAPAEPEATAGEKVLETKIAKLNKHIASLEAEIRKLRNEAAGIKDNRTPDRYKGIPTNVEGSPVQDPHLGDMTPAFIQWARKGGYTEAQFLQVYKTRLKDLSYLATKGK